MTEKTEKNLPNNFFSILCLQNNPHGSRIGGEDNNSQIHIRIKSYEGN